MRITLHVHRYNPGHDFEPYFQDYQVEIQPEERILDALEHIKRNVDASLGFRRSCAHGVCGSDAMRINGKEALACKTLFRDINIAEGDVVTIEPLNHMSVQRDLMVDQTVFFNNYRSVQPFFMAAKAAPEDGREFVQSVEEREAYDEATKCILCGACYSACPKLIENPNFIGPAAIVQAARFINDSRDGGLEARLATLDSPNGVWSCDNHFECTKACPRDIKITKLINLTKKQIKKYREDRGELTRE